jgi:serine/threonine protein kinase
MNGAGERVGDFVIGAALGSGGMGAVYRAVDPRSGRAVALKRLTGLDAGGSRLVAHFEREYRVLSQLAHPSVIEVYDYGLDQGGAPFYTMELLDGADLSALSPLPQAQVCALLHDVASSLALLHARGFVHRDVTARNIRVLADDRAKLIDFGAIAPMGPCEEIIGTPVYVPPEAVLGQSLDGRSDLYSLGVAMYYALTGRAPYTARRFSELRAAWKLSAPPPEQIVAHVHRDLSQLTMALLSLDRSARPRSAAEVMERLTAIGVLARVSAVAVV